MNPITQLARGLKLYWVGMAWLKSKPKYAFILCLPSILGLISAFAMFTLFWDFRQDVYGLVLFDAGDSTFWSIMYSIASFFVDIFFVVFTLISGFLLASVISSPIYDLVSAAVERDKTGRVVEVSIMTSIKLIPEELKKVLAILAISVVLMLLPVVNLFAIFITAFLLGWDFYDYLPARRGQSFAERRRSATRDFWAIMGMGLWLTIPVLHIFLYPFAVVGGTLMSLETAEA